MKRTNHPAIVLCAGLKSSGSTWLYNAVIELYKEGARAARTRQRVISFYAETVGQFPAGAERGRVLIVKTHIPSASLVFLTRFARGTVFLTVREPRDSVASLMQRFDHPFGACVKEVAAGGARMVELARVMRPLVLRYEDRFFEQPKTLLRLAHRLAVTLPTSAADRIFDSLSADKVRKKIAALTVGGAFGTSPDPDRFDPATHWHPGHVGDGRVGKYSEVLSPAMQREVLKAMHEYCTAFGYEIAPSRRPRGGKRGR